MTVHQSILGRGHKIFAPNVSTIQTIAAKNKPGKNGKVTHTENIEEIKTNEKQKQEGEQKMSNGEVL